MVRVGIQKTQETEVEDGSESHPLPELCPLSGKGASATQEKKKVGKKMSNGCLFLRKKLSHIEGWENHSGLYMIESEKVKV